MLERMRKWVKQTQKANPTLAARPSAHSSTIVNGKPGLTSDPHGGAEYEAPPSRWVQENFVPHGFADDDGAMKQVESSVWRNMYQSTREADNDETLHQEVSYPSRKHRPQNADQKSVFLLQSFIAGLIVVGSIYVGHSERPFAKDIVQFESSVFSADYAGRILPVVDKAFSQFHLSAPTFGVHAAVYMHEPLAGRIEADYSSSHPEIWLQGSPDAPVLAAGSGTVTKVGTSGGNTIVVIDHGAIGQSIYTGVASVSVQVHEYVDSGQVIGRLPTGGGKPELRFAMVKNGHFENPHDFIHFDTGSQ